VIQDVSKCTGVSKSSGRAERVIRGPPIGTWAASAKQDNRLEEGDVQEAIDAALAVGDFDESNPGHHGTPEQRADAWNTGFEAGDPASCDRYLEA